MLFICCLHIAVVLNFIFYQVKLNLRSKRSVICQFKKCWGKQFHWQFWITKSCFCQKSGWKHILVFLFWTHLTEPWCKMLLTLERHRNTKCYYFARRTHPSQKRPYWAQSNMWLCSKLKYCSVESVVGYLIQR